MIETEFILAKLIHRNVIYVYRIYSSVTLLATLFYYWDGLLFL